MPNPSGPTWDEINGPAGRVTAPMQRIDLLREQGRAARLDPEVARAAAEARDAERAERIAFAQQNAQALTAAVAAAHATPSTPPLSHQVIHLLCGFFDPRELVAVITRQYATRMAVGVVDGLSAVTDDARPPTVFTRCPGRPAVATRYLTAAAAQYPGASAPALLALLGALGAHCDCEIAALLGPLTPLEAR